MIDFERNLGGGEGGSVLPSAACSHPFPFFSLFSKKKRGIVFFSSSFWMEFFGRGWGNSDHPRMKLKFIRERDRELKKKNCE